MTPSLKDLLKPHLSVIFCGINPGLKSALDGHHFSNRSNRFWRVLHQAGFTPYQIDAVNDASILDFGYGLTTAVERATVRADELDKKEFADSMQAFEKKIRFYQPEWIAFLGKPAYQAFSGKRNVTWGPQAETFGGAKVWVLPNPSGLNRSFRLDDLVREYSKLLGFVAGYIKFDGYILDHYALRKNKPSESFIKIDAFIDDSTIN